MNKFHRFTLLIGCLAFGMTGAVAKENVNVPGANQRSYKNASSLANACTPTSSKTDLDINNVRAKILGGSDMWWDPAARLPRYEIPKGSGKSSLFAGALWVGGIDAGGNLKVAAMTYRQSGNDFWAGPIDTVDISTNDERCARYDKHFKITREEVEELVAWQQNPAEFPSYSMPSSIENWPGNGTGNEPHYLAPYVDVDGSGHYNPETDYPAYDLEGGTGEDCTAELFGDQTIWWVFNDLGNIHTESGTQPIGLEVHAQAFAFNTNDEINNMTFYRYKIINRSTFSLNNTYFGQWVDPDLGYHLDDYVGCDVGRGFGYCYNGDAVDEGARGYGETPPAVGVDFFEGPLADPDDGIDNDRDGIVDEEGELIIMSNFMYYNNDFSTTGNPTLGTHYYNYLRSIWKDNNPLCYGADGYLESPCIAGNFMFPGDTDPNNATPWDEATAGNPPHDRRFVQSAGPFTLQPGAVNKITTGAVWVRAVSGDNLASVKLLQQVDDKAQALFDNCFKVLDGPDAPDITIRELDKELILILTNNKSSNNYLEQYEQVDPTIIGYPTANTFKFQGYQIYQLKSAEVSVTDLDNPDLARLVAQVDVKDGVAKLVNYTASEELQGALVPKLMVDGADEGINHSFKITTDAFATGNNRLVNHKAYYFMAIAYAHNEFKPYLPDVPDFLDGQKTPYKAGRNNIGVYTGIPHIPSPENGGTEANSQFGDGPKISRIEGQGNGGFSLELTKASREAIVASPVSKAHVLEYEKMNGPVKVSVIDPIKVNGGQFTMYLSKGNKDAYWFLVKEDNKTSYRLNTLLDNESATWQDNIVVQGMSTKSRAVKKTGYAYISSNSSSGWKKNHIYQYEGSESWKEITPAENWAVWDEIEQFLWIYKGTTWQKFKNIVRSEVTVGEQNEQVIPDWGISISLEQVQLPGKEPDNGNGFIEASIVYENPEKIWFTGLPDIDGASPLNWVRSGTSCQEPNTYNDYPAATCTNPTYYDPEQDFEGVGGGLQLYKNELAPLPGGGILAPYILTAKEDGGPQNTKVSAPDLTTLRSVDFVLTPDKSKWSRALVFEMQADPALSEGGVARFRPRGADSYQDPELGTYNDTLTDGKPVTTGMSWFPGYAVDVETGERLNIAFGEDSWLIGENGKDMQFNPTYRIQDQVGNNFLLGGKHYVYVFGKGKLGNPLFDVPVYDGCSFIRTVMEKGAAFEQQLWKQVIWAGIPLAMPGAEWLSSEVRVKMRVTRPYEKFEAATKIGSDTTIYNGNNPMYTFNMDEFAVETGNQEVAVNSLDLINIVPNPYYAYSSYETGQLDNRVRLTNLPKKCTISFYTINGTLIRQFKKEDESTFIDWDLKNHAGIPIASGMYIIHVDVPDVGEKVLKWFGVMRQIDLESF